MPYLSQIDHGELFPENGCYEPAIGINMLQSRATASQRDRMQDQSESLAAP